jgi:hypothetical protein
LDRFYTSLELGESNSRLPAQQRPNLKQCCYQIASRLNQKWQLSKHLSL